MLSNNVNNLNLHVLSRESIIYKQMKDDDEVDEMLLDPDDGSNVRFKRSIVQINRSNNSTPISKYHINL